MKSITDGPNLLKFKIQNLLVLINNKKQCILMDSWFYNKKQISIYR